eukprot:11521105-Alexandrium_andersonii.AAC.1
MSRDIHRFSRCSCKGVVRFLHCGLLAMAGGVARWAFARETAKTYVLNFAAKASSMFAAPPGAQRRQR